MLIEILYVMFILLFILSFIAWIILIIFHLFKKDRDYLFWVMVACLLMNIFNVIIQILHAIIK